MISIMATGVLSQTTVTLFVNKVYSVRVSMFNIADLFEMRSALDVLNM